MAAYVVPFAAGTIVVGAAMVFVNPAAQPSASLRIIRCLWGQSSSAVSANLNTKIFSKVTAFPATMTSQLPLPLHTTGRASAIVGGTTGAVGTAGTLSSGAGAGAETTLHPDAPNNLNGWLWVPQLGDSYLFEATSAVQLSGVGFSITSTPVALTGFSGGLYFNEE